MESMVSAPQALDFAALFASFVVSDPTRMGAGVSWGNAAEC
jgi:hypothetical protein